MWRCIFSSSSLQALSLSVVLALLPLKAHSSAVAADRLVRTLWTVGTGLGLSVSNIAYVESRVRSAAQWAREHELPMPTGFSINVEAGAGLVIGGRIGAELVVLVPEKGNAQVGLFSATDIEVGAEATVGVGVGVSLVFNMERVQEMAGPIVGASTEMRMMEGVGVSILMDVEGEEIGSLKNALRGFAFEDQQAATRELRALIAKKRVIAIGAEMEWGVGGEASVFAGWRTQLLSAELSSDPNQLETILARIKRRIYRHSLRRKQFQLQ